MPVKPTSRETQSEFADSESSDMERASSVVLQSYEEGSDICLERKKGSRRSNSLFVGDASQQRPGWPLLRRTNSVIPQAPNERKMSVVQWVMSLPDRSPPQTPICPGRKDSPLGGEIGDFRNKSNQNRPSSWVELPKELEILRTKSSDCRWFSHEVLKAATSQFSSGFAPTWF